MSVAEAYTPRSARRDFVRISPDTLNEHDLTVDAIIASETPVEENDWDRAEYVPRVLTAEGARWPTNGQVPLLDSHDRKSTSSLVGSIRRLRRVGTDIWGTLHLAETERVLWSKIKHGHLTDISVGFRVLEQTYVASGERRSIEGRTWSGPKNIATHWQLHEGSLVTIGADKTAKIRGESAKVEDHFDLNADVLSIREVLFIVSDRDMNDTDFRKRLAKCAQFVDGKGPYWAARDIRDLLNCWSPLTPYVKFYDDRMEARRNDSFIPCR